MFETEDDFARLVGNLKRDTQPRPSHRDELRRRMLAAFIEARERGAGSRVSAAWRHRAVRAALAASIVILLGVGALIIGICGNDSAAASFADVVREVRQVSSICYNEVYPVKGREPFVVRTAVTRSGFRRREMPDGKVTVRDSHGGKFLILSSATKVARLLEDRPKWTGYDPLHILTTLHAESGKLVGRQTVLGRPANVFEVDQVHETIVVWADPDTNLPVRIDVKSKTDQAKDAPDGVLMRFDGFVWNPVFPDSTFSFDLPKGYAYPRERDGDSTEAQLIAMLRFCVKVSDGEFPPELTRVTVYRLGFKDAKAKGVKFRTARVGPTETYSADIEDPQGVMAELKKIVVPGIRFVEQREEDGDDWHYRGAGIKLGDKDSPVCWWRKAGEPKTYRVVYGNLSIHDRSADQLPADAPPSP